MNAEFFVYPLSVLASGGLIMSIIDAFNCEKKVKNAKKVKNILEVAIFFSTLAFSGMCLSLAGLCRSSTNAVYFCIGLVIASALCKVAVIQTEYKLVNINIVSELTLSWGFIGCCLLTL